MLTVAELPEFTHAANKLLTETGRQDIILYLARHPKDGNLMEGTEGVRKLRWGRGSQGKNGGRSRHLLLSQRGDAPVFIDAIRQR